MPTSAGLLMYRTRDGATEFLIVRPGGPWWKGKNEGAWSIPKGEINPGEEPLDAAQREFVEETGFHPTGPFIPLAPVRLKSGKRIQAWAFEGDCNPQDIRSVTFDVEWPPKSGRVQQFPEVIEARFANADEARRLLNPAQAAMIEETLALLAKK